MVEYVYLLYIITTHHTNNQSGLSQRGATSFSLDVHNYRAVKWRSFSSGFSFIEGIPFQSLYAWFVFFITRNITS